MPTLHLIDGASYLFRAFHALPPLTNKAGEPTGALFGVVNMLRKLQIEEKPEHVCFVFDAPGPTFRDEMYPQYKAHRPPAPADLKAQIEPLLDLVDALGFTHMRVAGVEADDVIGTLAVRAQKIGYDVVISTSDKDLTQLVNEHVLWVNSMDNKRLDRNGVIEKFGVPPERIIDYLTLVGDSVDNIPGVEKCGPKTAVKWLTEYGTLDGVIANADKVSGKVGEYLRAAIPTIPLSKALATVKLDCELPLDIPDLILRPPHVDRLRVLYERYGFTSALKELDGGAAKSSNPTSVAHAAAANALVPPAAHTPTRGEYACVLTVEALDTWISKLNAAALFCFDTETTSVDAQSAELVGIALAVAPGEACYIPLAHVYPGAPTQLALDHVLAKLKPLLEDAKKPKVAQHGKYDMNVLVRYGIEVRGLLYDTMLESYVLNSTASQHNMDALAKTYLGGYQAISFSDVAGKGAKQIGFADVDLITATQYSGEDADITLQLHRVLWPRLQQIPALEKVYSEIEQPIIAVLAHMERTGVLLDVALLQAQSRELGTQMMKLQQQAHHIAGRNFSLDSPKQLQAILFDELKLPVTVRTPGGQPSTNEEALEEIADQHELPKVILEYRGLTKLKSTYTDRLPEQINTRTGLVHTSYHQAVAATGRLSSSDPNLQNIPIRTEEGRRVRKAFIAPPGWIILAADYSQIELRIMAHLSDDAGLLQAFATGQDVHRATASEVFGVKPEEVSSNQRRAAKAINFGLIYGMSAFGLARNLGIERGVASEYVELYFQRYPGVKKYMEATRAAAHRDGYVETVFGRRLYLPNLTAKIQGLRQGAERAAINAPMQGTAADIIKRAMITVDEWLQPHGDEIRMLMQVHDELVFEVRGDALEKYQPGIRERMSGAAQLKVPLVVDIGTGNNWDEAH
jgi:DNA polymerase I